MFLSNPSSTSLHMLLAGASLALASAGAHAGVVNYGGNIFAGVESNPPSNYDLRLNRTEDNDRVRAFGERQGAVLSSTTYYNAHNPGNYQQNSHLVRQALPANGIFNSYIVHYDPTSGFPARRAAGFIDFSNPIYVITRNDDLDASDHPFGIPGVQYPTGPISDRGPDLGALYDAFAISITSTGAWRLDFDLQSSTGQDQIRIVELTGFVPGPGAVALLGAGGLLTFRRRRSLG
jgi:MYXO-CTERM domain-containing protein